MEAPGSMERVDREALFTSLPARIQFLHSFLEFSADDIAALVDGQKYIHQVIPAIVNIVYKKLLKYDITARVFTTRDSRDEGPVEAWVTEESVQIKHRKMFLRWYLTKLNSDPSRMEYWEYLDKVGLMHIGRGRRNPLHVDYVFLGVCLGYIQDSLFEAILSHPKLTIQRKIAIVKALGKVIWIQNDLFAKYHSSDGQEYGLPEDLLDEAEEQQEGYLHGKRVLGKDGSSSGSGGSSSSSSGGSNDYSSDGGSVLGRDNGKTSLGRPIEEADHMSPGGRCPFSGMSRRDREEALEGQRFATPSQARPAIPTRAKTSPPKTQQGAGNLQSHLPKPRVKVATEGMLTPASEAAVSRSSSMKTK
ncbi:hypothetical protein H2203_000369 [Taxawa tesnikishii (nom. ined.)]|nr:hypothetical protein H2203_000369 [Dothideales sp. JES 119]